MNSNNSSCLLCGQSLAAYHSGLFDTRFGIEGIWGASICFSCHLAQITPLPTHQQLTTYYETHYNFGGEKGTTYTALREWFLGSFLYRFWLLIDGDISFHQPRGTGRLLDIGCNEGRGLQIYKTNGYQPEGLELNSTAAAVARSKWFTVHSQLIEEFNPPQPYDVVVLSNVLEHSLNPVEMVRAIHRVLTPAGRIWISCPNYRSWMRVVFGRYWINWHIPFHIMDFSADSLRVCLEKNGFKNTRIKNVTPALWCAHSVISCLFARPGKPTTQLRSPVVVMSLMLLFRLFLFPFLWLGNILGRGDCLVVVAQRD
jgi:SAM-dependent methyltransferase